MTAKDFEFEGVERFEAPPPRVFHVLADLDELAAMIPDLVSSERVDSNTLLCVAKPGFSFLRGSLKLRIEMSDLTPPQMARVCVHAQGIGVSMKVDSEFTIEPSEGGSLLKWRARASEMKGLIVSVSSGLIRAAADQVIRQSFAKARARLNEA